MRRHQLMIPILFTLFLAACSSADQNIGITPPTVTVRHVAGVPPMIEGTLVPILFEVDVTNGASESVTVERLQISSAGSNSYEITSRTEYFKVEIPPGQMRTVNISTSARVLNVRVSPDEPLMLRAVLHFDSPVGRFRRVTMQQLAGGIGVPRR